MITRVRNRLAAMRHERLRRGAYRRPFAGWGDERLLLLGVDHRIPQSQIYPFHYYEPTLRARGIEVREAPVETYGPAAPSGATTVCFQTQFDISEAEFEALIARIRALNPGARLVYLDWFAPTDLRLAKIANSRVDLYVSKHLLRDRSAYGVPTDGDTTLMDYYGRVFGLTHSQQCFDIPDGFMEKLHLGPSFVTAPFMLPVFARGQRPTGARPLDLHARIAIGGSPWYAAMRGQCADAVAALDQVTAVTGTGIRHDLFLRELRRSKLCFSPFGYGEVCWRDFEAVMCGSVLIKQDMSHVETDPDIFVPHETYVPVRWDLSDFGDTVNRLLNDPTQCERIARHAFERLHDYASSERFVSQMAPLWEDRG